jgi:hypothetical protein
MRCIGLDSMGRLQGEMSLELYHFTNMATNANDDMQPVLGNGH